jgi:hypothetical protein
MSKKDRAEISKHIAARVLFLSNRTCCVCRREGKPVQIHHIDENPANNAVANLAVLCFDCHRETQIRGGFDRKLDAEQIVLYRDDWYAVVSQRRATAEQDRPSAAEALDTSLSIATSIAEIYRDNREYELLAIHYDTIGNSELRDKYVALALADRPSDGTVCFLRGLQDRPDLIPPEVLQRELDRYAKHEDFTQRGRLLARVGRTRDAAIDYAQGILRLLEDDNVFGAAYYIKELSHDGILDDLFVLALKRAEVQRDLWWQVRALQELDWYEELHQFLIAHRKEIEASDDPELGRLLAKASGDVKKEVELRKELARMEHLVGGDSGEVVRAADANEANEAKPSEA